MQCSDFSCFLSCLCVLLPFQMPCLPGFAALEKGQQHWWVSRLSTVRLSHSAICQLSELEGET